MSAGGLQAIMELAVAGAVAIALMAVLLLGFGLYCMFGPNKPALGTSFPGPR
jgi:hypothetical protein